MSAYQNLHQHYFDGVWKPGRFFFNVAMGNLTK